MSAKPKESNASIKSVIYDFDQTITQIHLYHELSDNNDQLIGLSKLSNDLSMFSSMDW